MPKKKSKPSIKKPSRKRKQRGDQLSVAQILLSLHSKQVTDTEIARLRKALRKSRGQ